MKPATSKFKVKVVNKPAHTNSQQIDPDNEPLVCPPRRDT